MLFEENLNEINMQATTSPISPRKKLTSPLQDITVNPKTSITCSNVPESLFDPSTVKKHFSKFGRVLKIRLFAKRQMCIIEYEHPASAERALLNAGAYDGFMFDVTRSKPRVRRRSSRKDDDPDWVPDSDVEEELSAMGSTPYKTRQNTLQSEPPSVAQVPRVKPLQKTIKQSPLKKKLPLRVRKSTPTQLVSNTVEPSMAVTATQTNLTTSEAASELHQLRSKISLTPDEQWRVLDARDRILRGWGGAGSRIKLGGATIGTCQDMCPEKELLQRQAEHQVMTLETVLNSDGELEPWRAVKQYSRSSADQDIPMCYELRPASVLMRTVAYLLHEIADNKRQVSMADWFHFMWDRLRGIRKDITQQALCCADSIRLVEMCARFHAHCAARLADLEHTQFDQKLNTDNLTKCLQTLKHMYGDVSPEDKPREAEFRGYIALLNLGDANFWWEIQQLPVEIQKSEPILFAIKVFNAIDNNNYVRFFRLVKNDSTYLQACILLRYFNDVRARGLARIVKAYAPRGGSRYPVEDLMRTLVFESVENLKSFINHYGLRFNRADDTELSVILDRNQFIEDSDPYPIARCINLIESKRNSTVGETIAGGTLPNAGYKDHILYTSFTPDGKLKENALVAEDQGYNTVNDSNKDVKALKTEIQGLSTTTRIETKVNVFVKADTTSTKPVPKLPPVNPLSTTTNVTPLFSFKPAIPVAPTDIIKDSSENIFGSNKNIFSFSKPQETIRNDKSKSLFDSGITDNIFSKPISDTENISRLINEGTKSVDNIFTKQTNEKPLFSQTFVNKSSSNLFGGVAGDSVFSDTEIKPPHNPFGSKNIFAANSELAKENKNIFAAKAELAKENKNIFAAKTELAKENKNIFGTNSDLAKENKNIFAAKTEPAKENKNIFAATTEIAKENKNTFGEANFFTPKDNKSMENQISLGAINIFANAKEKLLETNSTTLFAKSGNIFAKPAEPQNSSNIFGTLNRGPENTNLFVKPDKDKDVKIFSNGQPPVSVSPASLFKSILNGSDGKTYSIFQSKNNAQTVTDSTPNSVVTENALVYEFDKNESEIRNLHEQKVQEEKRKMQERIRKEEELHKQELKRQEEKIKEEKRRKEEEYKLLEEKRRKEEQRKQEELKKKLEQEKLKQEQEKKAAEIKLKADEERKFKERVDKESEDLIVELVNEINVSTVKEVMLEEYEKFNNLMQFAGTVTEDLISNLCYEICESEMKAERHLTQKIMRKWFYFWRNQYVKNIKRRNVLENTPVWLATNTPEEEAIILKRIVEYSALKNMNAIHRGYRFTGELKHFPTPEPYNIMEIIRSPLLKRMKQIKYPYDKCFFWKLTLVSPGSTKYLYRKVNIEKWLLDVFSDKKIHEESENLIHVKKQSWNRLMDIASSVSITSKEKGASSQAVDGTNGFIFYTTECDVDLLELIETILKCKYPYQIVPIAVIIPHMENDALQTGLEVLLADLLKQKVILAYRIFVVSSQTALESLNATTKVAMKWLARNYPQIPHLEIDHLKSICQRYLGNEIWCRLKANTDYRMSVLSKDLYKLTQCYNTAVEKLTDVITNEDLFNYPSFALEFHQYLDNSSPYPKPFEFIPSSVKTADNLLAIKRIMNQFKLPAPSSRFDMEDSINLQQQITDFCYQIGWFDNPEQVVCKVVAVIPDEISNIRIPGEDFQQYYSKDNLIDFMNIIVYEKINSLQNFENRFAIYLKPVLEDYCSAHWIHEIKIINELKHKPLEYEDEIDMFIKAKRRKVELDSLEYLMLEDKDTTMVEEQIKEKELSICKYSNCTEAVKELEQLLEAEKIKSMQFEGYLKSALGEL